MPEIIGHLCFIRCLVAIDESKFIRAISNGILEKPGKVLRILKA